MNAKPLFVLCALILNSEQLNLKQVVILSRHNVRTPLSVTLSQTSPKPWPTWNEKPGYLTPKGALLEGYMGEFFSTWLRKINLLPQGCPNEKEFNAYANTAQRTLASARSFVDHAFPQCNVTVHHVKGIDPVFNPAIHSNSSEFIQESLGIMQTKINNLHLNQSFGFLEQILDYVQSENCLRNHHCNLAADKNTPSVKSGSKPNINGPIKISKSVIDSFIMEYYEGIAMNKVAWGLLSNEEKWKSVLKLSYSYHNIIFNTTILAKDISKPLIRYMRNIFLAKNEPKVSLLMGHDANLYTVLNAMGFKPYTLKNQREVTPIGGKIVFQKWSNNNTDEFLKIDYVYAPSDQMRNGVKNPPIFQRLELEGCQIQANGLCWWGDFEKLLMRL